MQRLQLRYGPCQGWVYLRDLRGDDEESIAGVDTWSAIALVDRLLVEVPGAAVYPGAAVQIGAADRDRILVSIYRREFGDRVVSTINCVACDAAIDIDFLLGDLVASIDRTAVPGDGSVRVPSGDDELSAAASVDPARELALRCAGAESEPSLVAAALEHIAPLIDVELDARCHACGATPSLRFDMQHFMLSGLVAESRRRASEVHRLARSYRWSLGEILSLTRRKRKEYVSLVERDAGAM